MGFLKLVIQYWSQLVVVLGVIGYFTKSIVDSRNKQKEVRYGLFQAEKIKAVNNCIYSYLEIVRFYDTINFRDIAEFKLTYPAFT